MKTYLFLHTLLLAGLLLGACQSARPIPEPGSAAYYESGSGAAKKYPSRTVTVGVWDGLILPATYFLIGPRHDTATDRAAFRYRVKLVLQNFNDHEVVFRQSLRIAVPLRDELRIAYAEFPATTLSIGGETEAYYELTLLAGEPLPKPSFQLNRPAAPIRERVAERRP